MKLKNIIGLIPAMMLGLSSCNYLDIVPTGAVIPETVTEFRGILANGYYTIPRNKTLLTVRSDEMDMNRSSSSYLDIARWNDGSPDPYVTQFPWMDFYKTIFYANTVIHQGADATPDGSEPREQLWGEAYLLRAYMHFDLVNMYGTPYNAATAATDKGIPLNLITDIEQVFRRASVEKVYQQIEADIEKGLNLMVVERQEEGLNKRRFSKSSGYLLKARVALYKKEYDKALEAAKTVMTFAGLTNLNESKISPIDMTSTENLMATEKVLSRDLRDNKYFTPTEKVMGLYDQENDMRMGFFFNGNALKKGATDLEFASFRTAEAYLIAAEAAAYLNKTTEAAQYLATLADNRLKPEAAEAKKTTLGAMNQEQLITEIANERLRELIGENHRWFDLRRTTQEELTKTVNKVVVTLPAGDPRYTLRIPQSAIEANPELKD